MAHRTEKEGVISLLVGRIFLTRFPVVGGVCVCEMDLKLAALKVLSIINLTVFRPLSLLYSRT